MDTEYVLDCSLALAETTALENAVLGSRFGAYDQVRALVDSDVMLPKQFLQNAATAYLEGASPAHRCFFALMSLPVQSYGFTAFKERAEHLVQRKVQQDLGVTQRVALPGQLASSLPQLATQDSDVSEGLVRRILEAECGDLAQRWSRDLNLLSQAVDWYRCDDGQAFNALLTKGRLSEVSPESVMKLAAEAQQSRRRRVSLETHKRMGAAKAAIKKATKLFLSLGQQNNLQLLVSGQEVTLSHPDSPFKFIVRPPEVSGWLLDRSMHGRSHTPYDIELLTKDDVYLAKLCVYFDNTPVLDQLLALTLYVQSGAEAQVLEKANWFGMNGWDQHKTQLVTAAYPQLASKVRLRAQGDGAAAHLDIADVFSQEQEHWEPFKGRVEQWVSTWMEPARLVMQQLQAEMVNFNDRLQAVREIEQQLTVQDNYQSSAIAA